MQKTPSFPPQKLREIIFQMLYNVDFFSEKEEQEIINLMSEQCKTSHYHVSQGWNIVTSITEQKQQLDHTIEQSIHRYSLRCIHKVERNILRLILFETLSRKDLPKGVAISEAIRLCKKFGSKQSIPFINALLDTLLN